MPRAGLEPARPKTGDFKTSATPFIPIYADPATIGVYAETVTGAAFAKNSISPEYCLRGARDARVQGELQGESEGHKHGVAEALDLDPQRTSSGRERLRVLLLGKTPLSALNTPCEQPTQQLTETTALLGMRPVEHNKSERQGNDHRKRYQQRLLLVECPFHKD